MSIVYNVTCIIFIYILYLVNIYMYTSCSMGHLYINFIMSILSMSCFVNDMYPNASPGYFYVYYLMGLWSHICSTIYTLLFYD